MLYMRDLVCEWKLLLWDIWRMNSVYKYDKINMGMYSTIMRDLVNKWDISHINATLNYERFSLWMESIIIRYLENECKL